MDRLQEMLKLLINSNKTWNWRGHDSWRTSVGDCSISLERTPYKDFKVTVTTNNNSNINFCTHIDSNISTAYQLCYNLLGKILHDNGGSSIEYVIKTLEKEKHNKRRIIDEY